MFANTLKGMYVSAAALVTKDPLNRQKREGFDELIKWLKDSGLDVKNMDHVNQPSTSVETLGQPTDGPSTSGQSGAPQQHNTASQLMADNEEDYEWIESTDEDSDEEVDEVRTKRDSVSRPTVVVRGGPRAKRSYVVDSRVERYIKPGLKCGFSGCGQRSLYMCNLIEHIKRHLKIKDFKCKKCEKSFVNSHELKAHSCKRNTNYRK